MTVSRWTSGVQSLARRFLLLALAWILITSQRVSAHETWLSPSAFAIGTGAPVTLSLTSGMNFPELDYAISGARVASANFRQETINHPLPRPVAGKSALQFQPIFDQPGLIAIWATLHPKKLELSEAKVAEYFEEINATPEIRAQWAGLKDHHRWRETYTKSAKTYLVVGPASADDSWKNPVGLPLEIVPLADPTNMHAKDRFSLRLQQENSPMAGAGVGLIQNGARVFQRTDFEGKATFALVKPGPALFFAVQLKWTGQNWVSNFSTLCVEILQ